MERQRQEFGILPADLVECPHGKETQNRHAVVVSDFHPHFFVCRRRTHRASCSRSSGDGRGCQSGKVVEETDFA